LLIYQQVVSEWLKKLFILNFQFIAPVGRRADLNRTYLGEVERGVATPSLITIVKISKALNISASTLVAKSEDFEKYNHHENKISAQVAE
jgi:transcriptional regulator with XRE-family HTH domain